MTDRRNWEYLKSDRAFTVMVAVTLLACVFSLLAGYFHDEFANLMSVATFLAWHNIFETASIMVCFSVFIVSYFTYSQTRRLRTIILGSILLAVGMLDSLHTLSFKGMPEFFIENDVSNRATTLWTVSRLLTGICFFWTSLIPLNIRSKVSKRLFVIPPIVFALAVFTVVTYFPGWLPAMYVEGRGLTPVKILLEYIVMLLFAGAVVVYIHDYLKSRDSLSLYMSTAFILGIFSEVMFTIYRGIYDSFNYMGHIYKVIMFMLVLRVVFTRNVERPYIELSEAQKELKKYSSNLDRIVEQRTRQLKVINRKLTEDLEYAKDIQKAMLPAFMPDTANVSFSSGYFPAERLSGDFYDIFRIDDQHMGLCICDVSGHGVPAAMLTVFLKQTIETRMEIDRSTGSVSFPSTVLKNIYDSFNHSSFKDDVYMVLVYAIYNETTKRLIYGSAGLNTPPLLIGADGKVSEISISGFPICKFSELIEVEYADGFLELRSGDKILFYTDGLIDAQNGERERYSQERLIKVLEGNAASDCKTLSAVLTEDLNDFTRDHSLKDDVTFFFMEVV